jgi:hypothetical protein
MTESREITAMWYNGAGYVVRRDLYPRTMRVGIRQGTARPAAPGSGFTVRTYVREHIPAVFPFAGATIDHLSCGSCAWDWDTRMITPCAQHGDPVTVALARHTAAR